jgi:hypothetical protein
VCVSFYVCMGAIINALTRESGLIFYRRFKCNVHFHKKYWNIAYYKKVCLLAVKVCIFGPFPHPHFHLQISFHISVNKK